MAAGAYSDGDADRARSVTRALETLSLRSPGSLEQVLPQLRELLRCEVTCAYSVTVDDGRCIPDFFLGDNLSDEAIREAHRFFDQAPVPWGAFHPAAPDPRQRNVPLTVEDLYRLGLARTSAVPVQAQLYPKLGLEAKDQLRVLVCEDTSLLAWVGAFRAEPFTERERKLLEEITPALRERLSLERRLGTAQLRHAALAAALEQLGAPAFVLGPHGAVVEVNSAGRQALDQDRAGTRDALKNALSGDTSSFSVATVTAAGMADHFLAVQRPPPVTATERAQAAAVRWRLTRRQAEVLSLLCEGLSNRALATRLGCSESTVEIHVSAVLAKAGADSRAALVARVWSGT